MNRDPIYAMVSTYQEGPYWEGCIRSLIGAVDHIFILEGSCVPKKKELHGEPTNIGIYQHSDGITVGIGRYPNEAAKRNALVGMARATGRNPFWILTIDADEILVWGEYLRDWLYILDPSQGQCMVPLKRTEALWNDLYIVDKELNAFGLTYDGKTIWGHYQTYIAPSRCIHSSILDKYIVGTYIYKNMDGVECSLGHELVPQFPMPGEPHILHRPYYRVGERGNLRLRVEDEHRYLKKLGKR